MKTQEEKLADAAEYGRRMADETVAGMERSIGHLKDDATFMSMLAERLARPERRELAREEQRRLARRPRLATVDGRTI